MIKEIRISGSCFFSFFSFFFPPYYHAVWSSGKAAEMGSDLLLFKSPILCDFPDIIRVKGNTLNLTIRTTHSQIR